ncbi:hypothetical protein [Falsiroseomonas tokyonensis]|uniref:Uncharacterized protein n=1 Tax=Falsiroseomonas tokyonensis TaxID=430521 RepID=A0ABV7BNC3_9PROT|nr:hypothetical protein [Falsiroseomonas tokyonensis]
MLLLDKLTAEHVLAGITLPWGGTLTIGGQTLTFSGAERIACPS